MVAVNPTITTFDKTKLDTFSIPAQRHFMEATEREVLYSGAFGAGKSRIGCEKGLLLSLLYPGNRGLVGRSKFTDLRDTTMDTWFRYVMPDGLQATYNKQEHKLVLTNGSEILFYGIDQPTKVGSLEVGWIFIDEIIELTEEEYNMLLGRLRYPGVPFHQIFGATNPGSPHHWLYQRFYEDDELKKGGDIRVFESNANANPFTPDAYKKSLNTFKGKYKQRFVEGAWISFEGLVYDNWDPSYHILPRDSKKLGLTGSASNPIPDDDWDIFRVIDFGFTNPFVCQWWASASHRYEGLEGRQDRILIPWNERVWVMFKEIYMSGVAVPVHAREINRLSKGMNIKGTFADWDAGDRDLLWRAGIPTIKANKDVQAGIQTVYDMIDEDRIYVLSDSLDEVDGDLMTERKPYRLIHEFPGYERQSGKVGVRDPNEKPVKLNDHGMDALRYIHHTLHLRHMPPGSLAVGSKEEVNKERLAPPSRSLISIGQSRSQVRTYASGTRSWRR